ncbi:MAG: M15 family metallopeptidase [Actinomycetota bacterium]
MPVRRFIPFVAIGLILMVACTQASGTRTSLQVPTSPSATPSDHPSPVASPSTASSPSALPARFRGTVSVIPPDLAAEMRGSTWRKGCPVALRDIRLLTLRYWGFDGHMHEGRMVVNARVAHDVVDVFRKIFRARFAIKEIHLAVPYRGPEDDDPNDRRDYTVGFNCRPVLTPRGPIARWSQHAFGLAIDINPIENPYVGADGFVKNNHARRYRDRSLRRPGMIRAGDVVVRSFAAIGWEWGGYWNSGKDYMHFSWSGN